MPLQSGSKLGPYEVVSAVGAGIDIGAMRNYYLDSGCKRLLGGVPLRTTTPRMTLVTHWTAKLKK